MALMICLCRVNADDANDHIVPAWLLSGFCANLFGEKETKPYIIALTLLNVVEISFFLLKKARSRRKQKACSSVVCRKSVMIGWFSDNVTRFIFGRPQGGEGHITSKTRRSETAVSSCVMWFSRARDWWSVRLLLPCFSHQIVFGADDRSRVWRK